MSSKIVAAVPYQRGHSDSRSKSKSDKRPSGLLSDNARTIAADVQLVGSKPLLGNFGGPSTLIGGIHLPLGVSSISTNNFISKPGEFQRRVA